MRSSNGKALGAIASVLVVGGALIGCAADAGNTGEENVGQSSQAITGPTDQAVQACVSKYYAGIASGKGLGPNCTSVSNNLANGTYKLANDGIEDECAYQCGFGNAPNWGGTGVKLWTVYYTITANTTSTPADMTACTSEIYAACGGSTYVNFWVAVVGTIGGKNAYMEIDPGPITLTTSLGTTDGTYAAGTDNTGAAGKVYQWPANGGTYCRTNTAAYGAPPFVGGEPANQGALAVGAMSSKTIALGAAGGCRAGLATAL